MFTRATPLLHPPVHAERGAASHARGGCRGRRGFSLVEMMVTASLLALVLGSIIPTFSFFSKSISSLGNYSLMSQESRGGLERVGRDLHAAVDLTLAEVDELTLAMPAELGGGSVDYRYDADRRILTRGVTDGGGVRTEEVLFEDVAAFQFVYYNRLGVVVTDSPSIFAETKNVQVDAKLLKKVITTETSDYIISARFLMRNYN
ncbi:MAG: prepilin-type N-terminal cleavage/methylation domain-containing protein [Opitutales bacterium]